MIIENIGNKLNEIVRLARASMFDQGELAQLTYGAFDIAARAVQDMPQEEVEVVFPIGYKPDKTPLQSTRKYRKEIVLEKYQHLAFHQLSVNSLVQLVTIVETMLGDIVRTVVYKYPKKLGSKRTIPISAILESQSLQEIHLHAADALLNELAYKSPSEFAESVQSLISVNLLECPAFHKYMEIKATRDIYIHNRGVANEVYSKKAGFNARTKPGLRLPVETQYFLESYEYCLQIADWLEEKLNDHWHSSVYEERKKPQIEIPFQEKIEDKK